jgi:SAM-dependent MidA family methyltransferase
MTALKKRIAALITANGPLSVADYMALCLFDPQDGYYSIREPFGVRGDFTTAPEISQMFGELIGVWIGATWEALGQPLPVAIAEIGPGRGTLMKDVLRTLGRLTPTLHASARFAMIETSPRLMTIQKDTLAGSGVSIDWHSSVETLPPMPLIIVGNEIFDAVPTRQFVRTGDHWRERAVGLGPDGKLQFIAGAGALDPSLLPADATQAAEGAIFEYAPARTALMEAIATPIGANGGAGLFIDYGHLEPGVGDTLQALRQHRYEDLLANPGLADLTSHVDFAALADTARQSGLAAHATTQGDFLLRMGLLERAGRLGANASPERQEAIRGEVARLAGPDAMGNLFKVLAIAPSGLRVAPFSNPD